MAMVVCDTLFASSSPLSLSALTSTTRKPLRFSKKFTVGAQFQSMEDQDDLLRKRFMEFPYVSATRKQLMVDLMSTLEDRLQSQLLPCNLPPDVRNFKNHNGSAEASIHIRSGDKSSPLQLVINVAELIQNSPTSLLLILDLPHRKDLVLHPDYLEEFYQDIALDSHRQSLLKLPEVKPYVSPSLFVRSACSPTASMFKIDAAEEGELEEILRDHVGPAAKEVLGVWLDRCAKDKEEKRVIEEEERMELAKRDKSTRKKSLEEDLDLQFPRLFAEEVSSRVVHAIKEAFGVI